MAAPGPEILLPTRSTSPTPAIGPTRENGGTGPVPCSLCLSGPGKYTCPRCNAPYCSLACYKGPRHTACSELFYRDSVLQALREEAGPRESRRIEEMLQKLREEEASAEPAIDLDGMMGGEEAGLWDSLTPREKEDFHRLMKSGDIGALVPQWRPWWDNEEMVQPEGDKKIMELPEVAGDSQKISVEPGEDQSNDPDAQQHITKDSPNYHGDCAQREAQDRQGPPIHTARRTCVQDGSETQICSAARGQGPTLPPLTTQNKEPDCQNVTATTEHIVDVTSHLKETEYDIQKIGYSDTASASKDDANILYKETAVKEEMAAKPGPHKSSSTRQQCFTQGSEQEGTVHADELKKATTARKSPGVIDQSRASEVPPILSSIPPLCSLSHSPSPLVRFSLVNVTYSYAFSLLRHNGDLSDNDILLDFTGTLLCVSGALSTTAVFNSTAHALKSAVRGASDPLLGGDKGGACSAMEATSNILLGDGSKRYALAALSHLSWLLGKTRKLETGEKDIRKGAFNAKKKCLFLAAWVNENEDCLAILSAEVMTEYKQYLKDISEVAEISEQLQKAWGGKRPPQKKKLLQEVDSTRNEV